MLLSMIAIIVGWYAFYIIVVDNVGKIGKKVNPDETKIFLIQIKKLTQNNNQRI